MKFRIILICAFLIGDINSLFSPSTARFAVLNVYYALAGMLGGFANLNSMVHSLTDIFSVVINTTVPILWDNLLTSNTPISEDAYLNITDLAEKYNYSMEKHKVTTEDGYVLSMFRIPVNTTNDRRLVVFLMHGILDTADSWILSGKDHALAYILADNGYDVWMGNARGNTYNLNHVTMSPNQSEFWQFSWDEIGYYDVPAMIDYALNVSNKDKLYYVGHSQGTTVFYVMNSLRPEYNDKVEMMFSLAPIAWMTHAKSPYIKIFSPGHKVLSWILSNFNTLSPSSEFFNKAAVFVCGMLPIHTVLCRHHLFMIVGFDYRMMNASMLPVIYGHMPGGSSTYQFVHYGQLVENGRFCRFDYGKDKNLQVYGDVSPPDYDLSKVTTRVALYYSENDWLSDPIDVEILKEKLPNIFDYYLIPFKEFNHLDYMYANVAKNLIYNRIIESINKHESMVSLL